MRFFNVVSTATTQLFVLHIAGASLTFYVALQSTGLLEVLFDPSKDVDSSLAVIATNTDTGVMPGWLTSYEDTIYSISRTAYPDANTESGGVFAFREPPPTAPAATNLTLFQSESSNGESGVFVDVSPDGTILAATNIDGATVSIYPRAEDGTLGASTYVFHYTISQPGPGTNDSQIQANPHQSYFDPTGKYLFVPDRGGDLLYVYCVKSADRVEQIQVITLEPGTGPRHVFIQPLKSAATSTYLYLVCELDNTVRVFTLEYGHHSLTITLKQTISTLGPNLPRTPPINHNLACEVAETNDGKFVYAANRNPTNLDSDSIAVYSVDKNPAYDTHLTYLGSNETLGKIPRHFALSHDQDNRYLAVANQVTQDITLFERGPADWIHEKCQGQVESWRLGYVDQFGTDVHFVEIGREKKNNGLRLYIGETNVNAGNENHRTATKGSHCEH